MKSPEIPIEEILSGSLPLIIQPKKTPSRKILANTILLQKLLVYTYKGDRGSTVVKVLCYKSEGRWFDPSWCQWILHWHKILPIELWPGDRLTLHQKWVPGAFPGGKGGLCVRLTLPPSCAVVMKSGNLNSWNNLGLSRSVTGLIYLYILLFYNRVQSSLKRNLDLTLFNIRFKIILPFKECCIIKQLL